MSFLFFTDLFGIFKTKPKDLSTPYYISDSEDTPEDTKLLCPFQCKKETEKEDTEHEVKQETSALLSKQNIK